MKSPKVISDKTFNKSWSFLWKTPLISSLFKRTRKGLCNIFSPDTNVVVPSNTASNAKVIYENLILLADILDIIVITINWFQIIKKHVFVYAH